MNEHEMQHLRTQRSIDETAALLTRMLALKPQPKPQPSRLGALLCRIGLHHREFLRSGWIGDQYVRRYECTRCDAYWLSYNGRWPFRAD